MAEWKGNNKIPAEYTAIADAYAYVELVIDGETLEGENVWTRLTGIAKKPHEVATRLKDLLRRELKDPMPDTSEKTRECIARAYVQADFPLFVTYLAGKMGFC
jgi:hypothetical protein